MKKRFLRTAALAIAVISAASVFAGCQNSNAPEIQNTAKMNFDEGVHRLNYTETEEKVVKDGASDYRIVISEEAGERIKFAASDFQELFAEATGVLLPVITDNTATWSEEAKYFVIGTNAVSEAAGINVEGLGLGSDGFIVKTVGKSVFMAGEGDYGSTFGVYGYMEMEFDYDIFNNYRYYICRKTEVNLKIFDAIDIPDISVRSSGNAFLRNDATVNRRMRFTMRDAGIFLGSASAHTAISYYLKLDKYNDSAKPDTYHPKWYSSDNTQLCYTAHGDEEELEEMKTVVVDIMKNELINNDRGYIFVFSQEDKYTWCTCETCKNFKSQYGTDSAVVIRFINDIYGRVKAWMDTEEGKPYKRDFYITFLAYGLTLNPPVNEVKDVSGNTYYSPVDESVICDDGVVVMFAPIEMDYQQSIYAKDNLPFLKAFEGWRVISSQWNIYTYQANYSDYLAPFDTFNQMEDFYVYAAASNTYWIYDLGHVYSEGGATGWHMLKGYLAYKLAWDVNSGFNNLVDKYFEYNYGAAKDIMLQWFEEYRIHSGWMIDNYVAGRSSVYSSLLKKEYWSRNLLLKWLGYSETALELIEQEKNKEENLYRIYSLNIRMERVTLYYMLVKLYENDLDALFVNEIKAQCKADCIEAGITARSEGLNKEIENLWSEWGI